MSKRVLLIGGSYFMGRVFTILCGREDGEWELHVVNRGNAPLDKPGVAEYVCDRHDVDKMMSLLPEGLEFDAVIDFCAYEPNDIAPVVDALAGRVKQYIYISTSSVYINDDHLVRHEGDPVLYESEDSMVAQYICKKANLEKELEEAASRNSIRYTIARPAFVYGPFNYASRESWYIKKIAKGEPVPVLLDGKAKWNFIYVTDAAAALQAFVGDERAYGQVFNLSNDEQVTEKMFIEELEKLNGDFEKTPVTVADTLNRNIAIPWPLEEDELYSGEKLVSTFGLQLTPFEEGMRKANNAFMNVYTR